jgi:hypothetical protein
MLPKGDSPSSALVNRPKAGLPACFGNYQGDDYVKK